MTRLAWKVFISSKLCRLIVILRQEFIRHPFGKLLFLLYLWISQFPIKWKRPTVWENSILHCRQYLPIQSLRHRLWIRLKMHIFTSPIWREDRTMNIRLYLSCFPAMTSYLIMTSSYMTSQRWISCRRSQETARAADDLLFPVRQLVYMRQYHGFFYQILCLPIWREP